MTKSVHIDVLVNTRNIHVERVGKRYLQLTRSIEGDNLVNRELKNKLVEEDYTVDIEFLKSLDPKNWKEQDHYAVLGLGKLRFFASEDDIRQAYRKMVLQHHPDKRKSNGEDIKADDDYFTCITKAYEILGTQKSKRSFDSVDPDFDDTFPTQGEIDNDFYGAFNKCFERNARWSEKKNVPQFGDANSKREDVERFYNFWYEFKSWREFSYLDEEDKEKGQDRDERRWIEKENKAARIKRKKEEMMRIRSLVDLAYNNDKRIQKFKNEEKEKKLAAKKAKMDAVQAQKAEKEMALKEAQLAKERAEKDEQRRIEQIRIEKEQVKKQLKKERKLLRDKAKSHKYFSNTDKDMLKNMERVELVCETLTYTELHELNQNIDEVGANVFFIAAKNAEKKRLEEIESLSKNQAPKIIKTTEEIDSNKEIWGKENLQLLIKAFNLFPAGTSQRWDVIAAFICQHSTSATEITAREVLNKAKSLQNTDFSKSNLKSQENASAFQSFERSKKNVQTTSDISFATDCESDDKGSKLLESDISNEDITGKSQKNCFKPWTKEEQSLLEQAIKTYPVSTPDRWDRIAECIPDRTKKDCLRRVKELVELVNSKKEAKQAVK